MVRIRLSALKHGISERDIRHAVTNRIEVIDFDSESELSKVLIVGSDTAGNVLELLAVVEERGDVTVFHAMPVRKSTLKYIQK